MNISVTSPEQILKSPLNDSLAKFHWSFGRAQRFPRKKPSCDAFYNLPSSKAKRSTSFGSGKRSSFALTIDSPSPMLYTMRSDFEKGALVKGTSFGKNREECKQQGHIPTGPLKNPGPGSYGDHKDQTLNYTMRPKTAYPSNYFISDRQKSLTPGPGTYQDTLQTNPKGYMHSKIRNWRGATLSARQKRFVNSQSLVPGPGHYQDGNIMKKDGKYMLSTNRSDGRRSFMFDKRELRLDGNKYTPGPGYYRMPSDFGHYQKVPYQTLEASCSIKSKRPMTARK